MTYTEVWELSKEKLKQTEELILKTKNSDKVSISTELSYIDDDLNTYSEYTEKDNLSIVGSVCVKSNDDDFSEYNAAFLFDIEKGKIIAKDETENEFSDFENEIQRFITKLSATEDVNALIQEENDLREKEGEELIANFEKQLDNLKKYAIIGVATIALLALVIALIKLL